MSKLIILGVSARDSGKGSGKDTFADAFIEEFQKLTEDKARICKRSFADPLKYSAMEIFRLSYNQVYGTQEEKETMTVFEWPEENELQKSGIMTAREILQYYGSELMRDKFDKDLWVKSLHVWAIDKFSENIEVPLVVVAPDVRYPNETEILDVLVDVFRPNLFTSGKDVHKSETMGKLIPDSSVDFVAVNELDIDHFKNVAKYYCQVFLDKKLSFIF